MELYDIETDSEVYLEWNFYCSSVISRNFEGNAELNYDRTKKYLDQGKFVVTVGGEHSISYAPIRAHAEHFRQISVLQFDAHADLQPTYEDNPWSHASVMARVKELT